MTAESDNKLIHLNPQNDLLANKIEGSNISEW